MKKSLLIGINYKKAHEQNSNVSQLYGCINDTLRIASLLMDAYNYNKNDITILRDDFQTKPIFLPTRDNILQNLNKIIEESKDLSEITIYYAGHGSSINDVGIKDEKISKDEIIVPCDVMTFEYINR